MSVVARSDWRLSSVVSRRGGDAVVSADPLTTTQDPPAEARSGTGSAGRLRTGLLICCVALVAVVVSSLLIGSARLPPSEVLRLLGHSDGSYASDIINDLRLPRTLLGLTVGAALGVAGALMQAITRNPLADPGILGVNAGASLAVVIAVAVTGFVGIWFYLWFAFIGAAAASVLVYLLGATGSTVATPVRLALAGIAVSATIASLVQTVILLDQRAFDEFRFWAAGTLDGRGWPVFGATTPFLLLGCVLALVLGRSLNTLALGDDVAHSLGLSVRRIRLLTAVVITILAGAATAAAGPIAFVGLAVPHLVRTFTGPDQVWLTRLSLVVAPTLLLAADVLGRVLVRDELQVGLVTALIGGPVFVLLVRRHRLVHL